MRCGTESRAWIALLAILAAPGLGFGQATEPPPTDRSFAMKAAGAGQQMVTLGRKAQMQGFDPAVKRYARRVVDDHRDAMDELRQAARGHRLPLSRAMTAAQQGAVNRLTRLRGPAFDRAYAVQQAEAHQEAVSLFEAEARGGLDPAFRAFAAAMLPTLREHLRMARSLGREPPRGRPSPRGRTRRRSPARGQARQPVPEVPPPDPRSAEVPDGYVVEAVWTGLTYPTSVEIDAAGAVFVAEAGYSYGDSTAPARILRLLPNGQKDVFIDKGLMGPINDLLWTGDRLYISHRGTISFWRGDGLHHVVEGLPSFGTHQNNQLTMGPDRRIYFGQGTATNSGVVGLDSFKMGWLKEHPEGHDVPAKRITLKDDATFQTPDPIEELKNAQNRLVDDLAVPPVRRDRHAPSRGRRRRTGRSCG